MKVHLLICTGGTAWLANSKKCLSLPCRSQAMDRPSGTEGTMFDVAKKWMFSTFLNSFLGRPAKVME